MGHWVLIPRGAWICQKGGALLHPFISFVFVQQAEGELETGLICASGCTEEKLKH